MCLQESKIMKPNTMKSKVLLTIGSVVLILSIVVSQIHTSLTVLVTTATTTTSDGIASTNNAAAGTAGGATNDVTTTTATKMTPKSQRERSGWRRIQV